MAGWQQQQAPELQITQTLPYQFIDDQRRTSLSASCTGGTGGGTAQGGGAVTVQLAGSR